MYYAMSVLEILILLFILSLWLLSVMCFIKRFEKLSTIKRGHWHAHDSNINRGSSIHSHSSIDINAVAHKKASHCVTSTTNNLNYVNNHHLKNKQSLDEASLNLNSSINSSENTEIKASKICKASSEPNFHDPSGYIRLKTFRKEYRKSYHINKFNESLDLPPTHVDVEPLIHSFNSVTDNSHLAEMDMSRNSQQSSMESLKDEDTLSPLQQGTLLDPSRIPKFVRKSLLDLHKKSIYHVNYPHRFYRHNDANQGLKHSNDPKQHAGFYV